MTPLHHHGHHHHHGHRHPLPPWAWPLGGRLGFFVPNNAVNSGTV